MSSYLEDMTEHCEKKRYHHGALRQALIAAAEAELAEAGMEAFSLRKVAKRAGVSHAAPAHHFKDACGLLTALAAEGYCRFVAAMEARETGQDDPEARLLACGLGYIDFAEGSPALFRLIFSSERPDYDDPVLSRASQAAFEHLAGNVAAITGASPFEDADSMADALLVWSASHGIADLLASGKLRPIRDLPGPERQHALERLLRRTLPSARV